MAKTTKDEDSASVTKKGATPADPVAVTADDLKTEQEKGSKDPISDPTEPKPKDELEFNPVGPREPYPGGADPDPEEAFYQAHGFRRAKE